MFLPFDCFGGLYGVGRLLMMAGPNVLVGFAANAQGRMQGLVLRNACSCSFTFTRFPHNRCILKGVVFRNVCNHSFIFIAFKPPPKFRRWWLHVLLLPFACFGGLYAVGRLFTKAGPNVLVGFIAQAAKTLQDPSATLPSMRVPTAFQHHLKLRDGI